MATNSHTFQSKWHSCECVDSWFADRVNQAATQDAREKLASLLPFEPGAIIRVLDIGTGDGALSLEVLGVYSKAQLVCHDFSESMLARAQQRLAQFSKQVAFVKSNLQDPAWTHAIKGTFDAVVSSIAIHNVAELSQLGDPSRIREIYSEVFGLVKSGGCFLNYDYVTPPGPVLKWIYHKKRFAALQAGLKAEMGIDKSLREIEQEFYEQMRKRRESSREQDGHGPLGLGTILNQLEWLKQAGFDEVDCLWKETRKIIIGGFRH